MGLGDGLGTGTSEGSGIHATCVGPTVGTGVSAWHTPPQLVPQSQRTVTVPVAVVSLSPVTEIVTSWDVSLMYAHSFPAWPMPSMRRLFTPWMLTYSLEPQPSTQNLVVMKPACSQDTTQ